MIKVNISGEFTGTFAAFKKEYGNNPGLAGKSEANREQWLKDQYAKIKVEKKSSKDKAGD
jgi:hypothetical protein